MPYVSNNYAALYEFIQRQNQWFQYGDRVWVNHIDYVTQCTSFSFSSVDITDCNQKNAFICEIGKYLPLLRSSTFSLVVLGGNTDFLVLVSILSSGKIILKK